MPYVGKTIHCERGRQAINDDNGDDGIDNKTLSNAKEATHESTPAQKTKGRDTCIYAAQNRRGKGRGIKANNADRH